MGTVLQDLRFALRQFIKNPGFAALAILALALGIAANSNLQLDQFNPAQPHSWRRAYQQHDHDHAR